MAHIKYTGPFAGVVIPSGIQFMHGEPVEVDEKLAKSLTERDDFKTVQENRNSEDNE